MRSSHPRRPFTRVAAALGGVVLASCLAVPAASAVVVETPVQYSSDGAALGLTPIGSFETGVFDESAAEIVAFHAKSDRLFVVNAKAGAVDVLDASDPTAPTKLFAITAEGVANSVAVREDGLGVIALEAETKTDNGSLLFFDAQAPDAASAVLGSVEVGALPDMVTISHDGRYAVVANEGEPNDDYTVDPEGSVSVVALKGGVRAPQQSAVRTADFHAFEQGGIKNLPADVRVFAGIEGAENPVSANLEPEYVTIDGGTAYVTLQEANAVAVIDLKSASVDEIWSLGFKDHGLEGNGIDASDKDGVIDIRTFEGLKGVYMPDGISSYTARGETYLVTANEGDAREWGEYVEGERVKDLEVCADSPLAGLTGSADLGRLNVTTANGVNETEGCFDELYAFGGRSFSIWTTDGTQVFDSGDDFEQITAAAAPEFFNSTHTESNLEGRSDDKGPEPESVTLGQIGSRTYAFIGFERVGGIAVYDVTVPTESSFVSYVNNRDLSVSVEDADDPAAALAQAGDLGAEGVTFIPASGSPTKQPLLAVANEVSGTTTLFAIDLR